MGDGMTEGQIFPKYHTTTIREGVEWLVADDHDQVHVVCTITKEELQGIRRRIEELEPLAELAEAVLARRAMENALSVWEDSNHRTVYSHLYSLALNEVHNALVLENAILDAELARRAND